MNEIEEQGRNKCLAAISEAIEKLEGLKNNTEISQNEFDGACVLLDDLVRQLKSGYISTFQDFDSIFAKLYLHAKKQKHPDRIRFNPFVMKHEEFDEFVKNIIERSLQNPEQNYIYQCMVNAGHSAMIELRIVNGEKTAIFIDAAEDLRSAEENYIPKLIKEGFQVKIFVSDFDKKMLDPKSDELFSPAKILASRKTLFAPINFFRRIDKISLQNDMNSCKLFALSYMVQAGKGDYLNQLPMPSARTAAYLMRKKIEILLDAKNEYNINLKPYKINVLSFSSLPDRFIKTAQSTRVLKSREGLSEKYKKMIKVEGAKPNAALNKVDKKSSALDNFNPDALIYAVLPANTYFRLEKKLQNNHKLSLGS